MNSNEMIKEALRHVRTSPVNAYHVRAWMIDQYGMSQAPDLETVYDYCRKNRIAVVKTKRVVEI